MRARNSRANGSSITAANVQQARVFRVFGVDRILIANEVVDPGQPALAGR
jgi:D-serine deaminase-like pyridoxal phosphate-dependent protein